MQKRIGAIVAENTIKQTTFVSVAWYAKEKTTRRERFLAKMNAVIPGEGRKRGPLRDLLTIFAEGGAIGTPTRVLVFGHGVMEKALATLRGCGVPVIRRARGRAGLPGDCRVPPAFEAFFSISFADRSELERLRAGLRLPRTIAAAP